MLTILDLAADDVVAVKVDGKISTEQFEQVAALVEDKLRRHDKIRMYAEMDSFGGMSAEAFFADLKLAMRHWRQFDKEAVVTDKQWMKTVSEVAGKLLPGIEVRAFPSGAKTEARDWVRAH